VLIDISQKFILPDTRITFLSWCNRNLEHDLDPDAGDYKIKTLF